MTNSLKLSGLALTVAFFAGVQAQASSGEWTTPVHPPTAPIVRTERTGDKGFHNPPPPPVRPGAPRTGNIAPEVDPSLAIGGLTLLAGTLTVLRSRRRA